MGTLVLVCLVSFVYFGMSLMVSYAFSSREFQLDRKRVICIILGGPFLWIAMVGIILFRYVLILPIIKLSDWMDE